MNAKYEFYPPNYSDTHLKFFAEFVKWSSEEKWYWKLCQRNFFDNVVSGDILSSKEGHPIVIHEGVVNEKKVYDLDCRPYIKFLVDAMNNEDANRKSNTEHE